MSKYRMLGEARSAAEVRALLEMERCPRCGERDVGEPAYRSGELQDENGEWRPGGLFDVTCPSCGERRHVRFFEGEDFLNARQPFTYGGAQASKIIAPELLARELNWSLSELADRSGLGAAPLREPAFLLRVSRVCASELLKFIRDGERVPASAIRSEEGAQLYQQHPQLFDADFLNSVVEQYDARRAQLDRPAGNETAPVASLLPSFSRAAIAEHERWLANRGEATGQRMTGQGIDLTNRNLSERDLSEVEVTNVTFDHAVLVRSTWRSARIVSAQGTECNWDDTRMVDVSLSKSTFSSSSFVRAWLCRGRIADSSFEACDLSTSILAGSQLRRVVLNNSKLKDASLDDAQFEDCILSGADLAVTRQEIGMSHGARFVRCDLRNTDWTGRDLYGATFSDCKMSGMTGFRMTVRTTVERPDFSPAGDGLPSEWQPPWMSDVVGSLDLAFELAPENAPRLVRHAHEVGFESKVWVVTDPPTFRYRVRLLGAAGTDVEPMLREAAARLGAVPI